MLKQTVLKLKGALGIIGFKPIDDNSDGLTSESSDSELSEGESFENKNFYTSTGVIIPKGQPISEIIVSRLATKEKVQEADAILLSL
jgi:hypothetical protein